MYIIGVLRTPPARHTSITYEHIIRISGVNAMSYKLIDYLVDY